MTDSTGSARAFARYEHLVQLLVHRYQVGHYGESPLFCSPVRPTIVVIAMGVHKCLLVENQIVLSRSLTSVLLLRVPFVYIISQTLRIIIFPAQYLVHVR